MSETIEKLSVCPLDCPDTCSLSVSVQDGQIIRVRGTDANPYTAGVICNKVARYYPEFVHGEQRLTRPLVRTGERGTGAYQPVTWDDALDRVHAGLARAIAHHGPQSVMPLNYAGPHGQLAGGSMDYRFFHRLGASLLDRGPLCGGVRSMAYEAVFGASPGMAPEQAVHADVIAVWGNNVTVSNLHLVRVIKAARRQGARLAVIDPKRTRIAEQADLYLQIKPGTDVILAMALAAELERRNALDTEFIERWVHGFSPYMEAAREVTVEQAGLRCDVSTAQIHALADYYATARNLSLSIGNGIERGRSGGAGLRAVMTLNALTGQLGRPGAGVLAKPGLSFPLDGAALQRPDLAPAGTRRFNIVDAARVMLDRTMDPPIGAVFIYNHNPVATHPDQNRMRRALSQSELFVVGSDLAMTDSMRYADVILPAASHFEHDDVFAAYGQNYLQRASAVIDPVGESLPNTEIFRRLAQRFGFEDAVFKASDQALMDDAVRRGDYRLQGFTGSQLPTDRALAMQSADSEPLLMCHNVTPKTPSGKIELYSERMEQDYGCGLPRFEPVTSDLPFNLITPASSKRTNTTFGGLAPSAGRQTVQINPRDAQHHQISDGQPVVVSNALGRVDLVAQVTDAVAPGVLYSAKGAWLHTSGTDQTTNALIDADLRTDIGAGACYNDTWVRVEAV